MSSDLFGPAPKMAQPAIRVDNVSKRYVMFERPEDRFKQMIVPRLQRLAGRPPTRYFRDFAALNGVSLEVGRGETVGIIGRNGSGKSTLLQIICGTLQPTSGAIEVNGRIAALLELGAGFNPEFTGRENVFLNAQILGVPRQEIEWRFDDIARFADIGPFIEQPVKTYSSGMYVRLAFAVAINVDPDILVVDEALSVGDEAFQRKCFARIEDIKDKGGTILFVSHGAQTIVQLCTRAVLIDAGEKLLEGAPKRVVGQYQRLVNASAKGGPAIREELLELRRLGPLQESQREQEANTPIESRGIVDDKLESETEDFFDPDLRSESRLDYESKDVEINNVRILAADGQERNILALRRRYSITYDVTFSVDATNIAFGFTVSTVSGLTIGGAGLRDHRGKQLRQVRIGQTARVRFSFDCLLLPGFYMLTVGCSGVQGGAREYLHRILDAYPFKVLPDRETIATGIVDLKVDSHIEIVRDVVE